LLMKTRRIALPVISLLVTTFSVLISCQPGSSELTPAMKEYRLEEITKALEPINSQGLISSLSADDSTLIVTIADEQWLAATTEEQNRALEVLGNSWVSISEKIGVKEPELSRLRVVALDRFQKEYVRWTPKDGVQR